MKFLIDNAISPIIAMALREKGHDATHLRDYNMQSAKDSEVFELARKEKRILISADADFGSILALKGWKGPSLILFRGISPTPAKQAEILLLNLQRIRPHLEKGCVVVFEKTRIRLKLFNPD